MNVMPHEKNGAWILIAPWLIVFCAFWLYPLFYALYLSFTEYHTLTNQAIWIGFENYIHVFQDQLFWRALLNTTIFTFGTVPVTTILALLLAVLLNSRTVRFSSFFRAAYFMPTVTSLVVVSLIFTNLYTRDGYVNSLMKMINLPYPEKGWLLEPSTALLSIMAMDVWMSVGYYAVLFLAGLQTIQRDFYEAADLAGASKVQQFFKITIPLIKPTMLFVVIINTIKSFQVFIEIYVMTKGGPLPLEGTTTTLVYEVYKNAFEKTDAIGYASALAYVVFAILLIISSIQMKLFSTNEKIR